MQSHWQSELHTHPCPTFPELSAGQNRTSAGIKAATPDNGPWLYNLLTIMISGKHACALDSSPAKWENEATD